MVLDMTMNLWIPRFSALILASTAFVSLAEEAPAPMPSRQVLLEQQLDIASRADVKVFRVNFPKGYKTPEHQHEGAGPRYVLKGRIKITDNGQSREYGPGQVFWESGQTMTAENISDGEAEMVVFEVANPSSVTSAPVPAAIPPAAIKPSTPPIASPEPSKQAE